MNQSLEFDKQTFEAYGLKIDVPREFFVVKGDTIFIKYGGLLHGAKQLGMVRMEKELLSMTPDLALVKCSLWLIPNKQVLDNLGIDPSQEIYKTLFLKPIEAFGSATPNNLGSLVKKHPFEMADTRANVRALRVLLSCSFTAIEEIGDDDARSSKKQEPASSSELRKASEPHVSMSKRDKYLAAVDKLMNKDPTTIIPRVNEYLSNKGLNVIANCDEDQAGELYEYICRVH